MTLSPEQIHSLAREDLIEAVHLSLAKAKEHGLISYPTEIERRAAAALIFDQLSWHITIKMLVGMAQSMKPPEQPEAP